MTTINKQIITNTIDNYTDFKSRQDLKSDCVDFIFEKGKELETFLPSDSHISTYHILSFAFEFLINKAYNELSTADLEAMARQHEEYYKSLEEETEKYSEVSHGK